MKPTLLTEEQVREALRNACAALGGQAAFAREMGVQESDVSRTLHGAPPPPIILRALALSRVTMYRVSP